MGTNNAAGISYSRSYCNSSKTPPNTIISCLSYVSGYISSIKNTSSFHKLHLYLKNLKALFKIKYSNLYIPFGGRLGLLGLERSALKCRLQLLQTSRLQLLQNSRSEVYFALFTVNVEFEFCETG